MCMCDNRTTAPVPVKYRVILNVLSDLVHILRQGGSCVYACTLGSPTQRD